MLAYAERLDITVENSEFSICAAGCTIETQSIPPNAESNIIVQSMPAQFTQSVL